MLVAGANPAHWPIVRNALHGACTSAFAVDLRGTLDVIAHDRPAMLLLCSDLLDASARACLERVREQHPHLPALVIGADDRIDAPDASVDKNVAYLPASRVADELALCVGRILTSRRRRRNETLPLSPSARRPMVMGTSPAMRRIVDTLQRVAGADVTVLFVGETGCGKEVLARRLHCLSDREGGPFRAVSVPAVPRELFESVLFGHQRGAFTGAVASNDGAFAQAEGGTLFLDEVSSMVLECQAKLLRAIQEREIEPVGGGAPKPCDVRIVAASNVDLRDAVAVREFREDLYHRLSVVTIEIPPLRERREDIPPLVEFFVRKYARKFRRERPLVSDEAMSSLMHHEWTGNVRELENRVQKALLLASEGGLRSEDFFGEARERSRAAGAGSALRTLAEVERAYIEQVLVHTEGNQSRAAEILGIDRKTLRARLRRRDDRMGYLRARSGA